MPTPILTGTGFLAGEAPHGLTTIEGMPTSATVQAIWRDPVTGEEVLAGSTESGLDGTWRITNLNHEQPFVVRAIKPGLNDVTVVGVEPTRADVIEFTDLLEPSPVSGGLVGHVHLDSGIPPFTATVTDPLPYGLFPVIDGRKLIIDGTSYGEGVWNSVVRVTASNGVVADVPVEVVISVAPDPHWDKVVSLLHFDGDLTDETGREWTLGSAAEINSSTPIFGSGSLETTGLGNGVYTSNPISDTSTPFTVETYVEIVNLPPPQNGYGATDWMAFWGQTNNSGNGEYGLWMQGDLFILELRASGGRSNGVTLPTPLVINKRYHLAHTFDGTTHRAFLDGVLLVSVNHSIGWPNTDQPFRIGQMYVPLYDIYRSGGYCLYDSFRITKGVARYTANFTPPDKPFPSR